MPVVLGPLLIPFLAFVAAFVLVGLAESAASQHGTQASGTFYDWLTGKAELRAIGGFAARFSRWIVSRFAAGQLVKLAHWFLGMGTLTIGLFTANPEAFEALVHAIERVMHRGDPRARARAQTANHRAIHAGHAADHANIHARSVGHALNAYKARTNTTLRHHTHAIDVTLPRDIGRVRTREDALSRDLGGLRDRTKAIEDGAVKTWDWIRTHPFSGATALFGAAALTALAHLGFGFLRCRNWQNLGRRLTCGMGKWILDALDAIAAFALGALAVLRPEVLAEETVQAVDSIEFILTRILSE